MHENISTLKKSLNKTTAAPMFVPLRATVGLKEISVVKIKLAFFIYKHFLLIIIQVHVKRSLKIGIRIGSSFLHTCQCINNIVTHFRIYTV